MLSFWIKTSLASNTRFLSGLIKALTIRLLCILWRVLSSFDVEKCCKITWDYLVICIVLGCEMHHLAVWNDSCCNFKWGIWWFYVHEMIEKCLIFLFLISICSENQYRFICSLFLQNKGAGKGFLWHMKLGKTIAPAPNGEGAEGLLAFIFSFHICQSAYVFSLEWPRSKVVHCAIACHHKWIRQLWCLFHRAE